MRETQLKLLRRTETQLANDRNPTQTIELNEKREKGKYIRFQS